MFHYWKIWVMVLALGLVSACGRAQRVEAPLPAPPITSEVDSRVVVADLAPQFAQAAARRATALYATKLGDARAALELIELGCWDAMAELRPFDLPLVAWCASEEEVLPGVALHQVWGELAANWAVRQRDLDTEQKNPLMLQAREALERDGTQHPVLLDELAWLYEDVVPQDPERARLIKLALRVRLMAAPPLADGGIQAYRLVLRANLVETDAECLTALAEAAGEANNDPIARLDALLRQFRVLDRGRSTPLLDVPIAQRKGHGSRTVGSRKGPDPRLVCWQSACAIAVRCADPKTVADTYWAAAQWAEANRQCAGIPQAIDWARGAARAFEQADSVKLAAEAEALHLILDDTPADWTSRAENCQHALTVEGISAIAQVRLQIALGVAQYHRCLPDASEETFADAFLRLESLRMAAVPLARTWLDFARAAAGSTGIHAGRIHDLAAVSWDRAGDNFRTAHELQSYAETQRDCARFIWNDGPEKRDDAVRAFYAAAAGYAEVGHYQNEDDALCELADHLCVDGDLIQSRLVYMNAANRWHHRSKKPDDHAALRAADLEGLAGFSKSAIAVDSSRDVTQGRMADMLTSLIGMLSVDDHAEIHELFLCICGWPVSETHLDADHVAQMRQRCHLNSADAQRLAEFAMQHDDPYVMQIVGAIGHEPLAPMLAGVLKNANRHEFGYAAAEAFAAIADRDDLLAISIADRVIELTWDDACTAVIKRISTLLPPDRFRVMCRDLVIRSSGENKGILDDLINILARNPSDLPLEALRRHAEFAVWSSDRAEALWALGLVEDAALNDLAPRLLADVGQPLDVRRLALSLIIRLRLVSAGPAVQSILNTVDPESDSRYLLDDAVIATLVLNLQVDQERLRHWADEDWGEDPDPETLATEGPPQRYRILAAQLARWLTTQDPAAWKVLMRGVAHPWCRYRCHIVTAATCIGGPGAVDVILHIIKAETDVGQEEQRNFYRDALSRMTLDPDQRRIAEDLLGVPIPPSAPMPSPHFNVWNRPCDDGPAAPVSVP